MNKPWNMARARANQRPPRKHKPLAVGPDEATVAHVRNRDHAALRRLRARDIKGVDFGILEIDEAGVQPTRETLDRATSMPDTLPPGWELNARRYDLRYMEYNHTSGACVWQQHIGVTDKWYISASRGAGIHFNGTRNRAMDAALALVPVGKERERMTDEIEHWSQCLSSNCTRCFAFNEELKRAD